ncbi:phosphoribosyltransferase-like protein [Roseateles chitinivorans]|uniref:phosphoribosyltransferase-like protein n=1 Tax=Roseateles chitinivorans TaxID=2917965 RepID=UPI003D6641A7
MKPSARHLLLTKRGAAWLEGFDEVDKPMARELSGALSLVSLSEFERSLIKLVLERTEASSKVALYSAREFEKCLSFEENVGECESGLDATPRGSDIGSEGRTAHIARQIARTSNAKFVLHPSISKLRALAVDQIIIIDDLLGTGNRCLAYLEELWKSASLKSWWSYHLIKFSVLAYAGTEDAIALIRRHNAAPEVCVHRYCPTISSLSWSPERRSAARAFCRKYAKRWQLHGRELGYENTASLLVFEHGCPNNVPPVFWSAAKKAPATWQALFHGRSASGEVALAFPHEFESQTPVSTLLSAGRWRLAETVDEVAHRPLSANMLVFLSLIHKGRRRLETLSQATGLDARQTRELLESCIAAGFITPLYRITSAGLAEILGASKIRRSGQNRVPELGPEDYYPTALRGR